MSYAYEVALWMLFGAVAGPIAGTLLRRAVVRNRR